MNSHKIVTNPILLTAIAEANHLDFELVNKTYIGSETVNNIGEPLPTSFEHNGIKYQFKKLASKTFLTFEKSIKIW